MPEFSQIIAKLDFVNLAAIAGMMWFFYSRLNDKIEKLDVKVTDIDKRLFAVETMLHMKDCCMLKDDRINKIKAQ
jgi:hypothetical protein